MQGDSGTPLVLKDNTVIGVYNFGDTTCNEGISPGIYARVTSFVPFIKNVITGVRTSEMRIATYRFTFANIFGMKTMSLVEI